MERKNRHIRMTDEEWENFRLLLGATWLRKQIERAIKKDQRKPSGATEYLLSTKANRTRLMESIAQHKKSKDA